MINRKEEEEETQINNTENTFKKNYTINLSEPKKEVSIKVQEAHRASNILNQQGNSPQHVRIKTLHIHNKERILKFPREKSK